MSQEHSYDAVIAAGAVQQQQAQQSLRDAAALAQKHGIELGPEVSAELANPTAYTPWQYEQQIRDATPSTFYEQEMWMNVQPRQQAKPVDTRPQQEVDYEQYLIQKQKAEQPQEQAEQVQGQNARLVAASLEYGWEDSGFQQYLDSDDDAYMSMRLSPQQLQLANEVWGLDEDTARAYVYHHKLTADDLALIEQSFLGTNLDAAGDYDSVAALNDVDRIRHTYFPKVSNDEWSKILNGVIDEFESLSPEEHEKYTDPIAGFWAMHLRIISRRQQQTQPKPDVAVNDKYHGDRSKTQRQQPKRNTQGFSNTALTPRGFLRQSWIDKLSPDDYAKNADRITAWYVAKKIDFNA
ncbi:hypothetical protein H6G17_05970 [Chroococcidiopsis sp. FACHB-1243]|uniref:hypothetical protein n=1 Tax=Chroococcidiopsis sp. [FACHB-1243] TaxID=2692781 RepID=UPI001786483A|nr:hypothetical protein [Chroococcidiopsis sp. [FACHB-1243]]MBD2305060.1 hypothetical protein [Chroococcidiopsis sp. [FACHB-1243]]